MLPRCTPLLFVGLALGACGGSSDGQIDPAQRAQPPSVRLRDAPDSVVAFRFDWPTRGPRVEEARWDLRRSHHLRYGISLAGSPDADGAMIVRQRDLEVLQLSGRDSTGPSIEPRAPLLKQTLMPLELTPTGQITRPVDREAFFAVNANLFETAGPKAERIAATRMARAAFEYHASSYWNAWSGWFAGLELAPGESVERSIPLRLGESVVRIPATIENRGPVDDAIDGHWHLVARASTPGPTLGLAAATVLLPWLANQRALNGVSAEAALGAAARARVIVEAETVTTTGLRPKWAFHRIALEFGGEFARVEDVERTLYTFDWAE